MLKIAGNYICLATPPHCISAAQICYSDKLQMAEYLLRTIANVQCNVVQIESKCKIFNIRNKISKSKFPLVPMGVLSPGSANAHKNLKLFSIKILAILVNTKHQFCLFLNQKDHPLRGGDGGGGLQILFLGTLKPHTKFQNPRTTPSKRKVTQERGEKLGLSCAKLSSS